MISPTSCAYQTCVQLRGNHMYVLRGSEGSYQGKAQFRSQPLSSPWRAKEEATAVGQGFNVVYGTANQHLNTWEVRKL